MCEQNDPRTATGTWLDLARNQPVQPREFSGIKACHAEVRDAPEQDERSQKPSPPLTDKIKGCVHRWKNKGEGEFWETLCGITRGFGLGEGQ